MSIRQLKLAPDPCARTSAHERVTASSNFESKRTKTATKRTSLPVGGYDGGVRELDSILREIAELRPGGPRAGGTFINNENQITLASGRTISKATLFRVLQGGGWIAFGTFVWALNISDIGPIPAAVEQLIWVGCGFLLTLGFRSVFHRACGAGWSFTPLIVLAAALSVAAGPLWYVVFMNLLRLTMEGPVQLLGLGAMFAQEAKEVGAHPMTWPPIGHWMFFTSLLSTWCSLYFGIKAMLDLEAERARSVRALKLADSARLRALQSQLNPHFLFNALNGIATLVREGDRSRAAATVETLSDFLRLTLQKLDQPEIPVREELMFVEQYLHIQRLRFGSAFNATVDAAPETREALVPTLILQPLVENAVRHGVLARAKGGSLTVSLQKREELLVITVEDDGPGLEHERTHAYGVGFRNSAERLAALYGEDAHMSVGARPRGQGFVVVVFLPFRPAPARAVTPAPVALTV
jgi:two-component system, LytTR family, sensor kinase